MNHIDAARARRGIIITFSLGILAMVLIMAFTFDISTIGALKKMDSAYLGLAVIAIFGSWVFSSAAFYILAKIINAPISLAASGRVHLAGAFFGSITPFSSGLLPTQIYLLSQENLSPGQATAVASTRAMTSSWLFAALGLAVLIVFKSSLPKTIGTNLLFGVVAVAVIWSALAIYFIKKPGNAKSMVALILASKLALLVLRQNVRERIESKIDNEIDHLSLNLRDIFSPANYLALIVALVCEMITWVALFSVLPFVLLGLGWEGSFLVLVFRMFLIFSLIPASPTPGGSGVVELGFTGLLHDLVPLHIIGLVVLIWRALTYYLTLLIGGVIALRFFTRSVPLKPKATDQ